MLTRHSKSATILSFYDDIDEMWAVDGKLIGSYVNKVIVKEPISVGPLKTNLAQPTLHLRFDCTIW
jgi:hypothetical protein